MWWHLSSLWIGLTELADKGDYKWSDGTLMDFNKWNAGEPNDWQGAESCVEMYMHSDPKGLTTTLECRPNECRPPFSFHGFTICKLVFRFFSSQKNLKKQIAARKNVAGIWPKPYAFNSHFSPFCIRTLERPTLWRKQTIYLQEKLFNTAQYPHIYSNANRRMSTRMGIVPPKYILKSSCIAPNWVT